jgi:pyruvate formate lyase activating enzyme
MEIKGFIETSLIDWDGKLVSVFFLPGCNFRCPFCHNHQLWKAPQNVETVPWLRISEFLAGKKGWIDGAVITGGEPTIHQDLPLLLLALKDMGLEIKIDTNGANPEMLAYLLEKKLVDYVAMDLKAPLDQTYNQASGVEADLEAVKRSIAMLMEGKTPYEFRTTVVPLFHSLQNIKQMGRSIKGAKTWVLQQFVPQNSETAMLKDIWPYDEEYLGKLQQEGSKWVESCILRGITEIKAEQD